MLKFRIAKCLVNDKIVKCAIFEKNEEWGEYKRRIIEKDSKGKEYFTIPNTRVKSVFKFFTDRIGDAVDEVINGDGDAIKYKTFLGMNFINVAYFIDREYGEEMKRKTIEGWKDTKFAWVLKICNFHQYVKKDGILTYERNDSAIDTFNTEEDALERLSKLTDEAYSCIEKYKGREVDECFNEFIRDLNKRYNLKENDNKTDLAVIELISKIVSDNKYFEPKVERDKFRATSVFKPYQLVIK